MTSDPRQDFARMDRWPSGQVSVDTKWFTGSSIVPHSTPATSANPEAPETNLQSRNQVRTPDLSSRDTPTKRRKTSAAILREAANLPLLTADQVKKERTVDDQPTERPKILADSDAPLPAPLHIIEAVVPNDVSHQKMKHGDGTWSVSDLRDDKSADAAEKGGQEPLPVGDAACIFNWLSRLDEKPRLSAGTDHLKEFKENELSCRRDIDTTTSAFLPPLEMPMTITHEETNVDHKWAWNKINMNSELFINREMQARERLATAVRIQKQEKEAAERPPLPDWPSTDCTLRPVTEAHLEAIADILSKQRDQKILTQPAASKAVQVSEVRAIMDYCRRNLRPFVVACLEEEDLLDRSKWPPKSTKQYLDYVEYRKSQPSKPKIVVGCAWASETRVGLLNNPCPMSQFAGQVRLFVHPDHYQKNYGTALLDRILLSVAPYHKSLIDYDWVCDDPANIYEPVCVDNRRMYSHVYVEVLSKKSWPMPWIAQLLAKFDFKRAFCLEEAVRTDEGRESKWLDLEMWRLTTQATVVDDEPGQYLAPK